MNNVVNLFSRKTVKAEISSNNEVEIEEKETTADFEKTILRNNEIKERLRKERLQANKTVIKNYNIK